MSAAPISVAVAAGVATVTIDSPPINLIDAPLFGALRDALPRLGADPEVRVVVLRSANPGWFLAHFDVTLILRVPQDAPAPTALNSFQQLCEQVRTMSTPTIALVEGRCGGGGSELALSCDIRIAALGQAVFNQPEVALGILPGGTGTARLARLAGRSRALEVVLGCDDVDAGTAERYGWVNRALPPDQAGPFVERLAARIAGMPRVAVEEAKAAVLRAEGDVTAHLVEEHRGFQRCIADPEAQRRMRAFLERGGQTVEGEQRLGDLAAELAD